MLPRMGVDSATLNTSRRPKNMAAARVWQGWMLLAAPAASVCMERRRSRRRCRRAAGHAVHQRGERQEALKHKETKQASHRHPSPAVGAPSFHTHSWCRGGTEAGQQCFNTRGWCVHRVCASCHQPTAAHGPGLWVQLSPPPILLARITASGRPHAPLPTRSRTCMHMPLPR